MNILDTLSTELTQKLKLRINRIIEEAVNEALGISVPPPAMATDSILAMGTRPKSTRRAAPRKRTRLGSADREARQQQILKQVQTAPKSISEIATALGKRAAGVGSTVHHMQRAGMVIKKGEKFLAKAKAA